MKKQTYDKNRYLDNRDKILENRKEYYESNKVAVRERTKTWAKNNPKKKKLHSKAWNDKNKEHRSSYNNSYKLKSKYGMSVEEYNNMFSSQGGRCAVCGKHQSEIEGKLGVDHSHTTNKVRGLLCFKCNLAIGLLGDCIGGVLLALKYLEEKE